MITKIEIFIKLFYTKSFFYIKNSEYNKLFLNIILDNGWSKTIALSNSKNFELSITNGAYNKKIIYYKEKE